MTKPVACWILSIALALTACTTFGSSSGRVAFLRDGGDGTVSLWVMNGDGSELAQIVAGATTIEFPPRYAGQPPAGFSRGGQKLLFRSWQQGEAHLFCADLTAETLTDLGKEIGAFSISTDGQWVLIQSRGNDGLATLMLVSACDDEERRPLITGVSEATGLFSPDGKYVLVTYADSNQSGLKIIETRSGDETTLASSNSYSSFLGKFTLDGQSVVAYVGNSSFETPWQVYDANSGEARELQLNAQTIDQIVDLAVLADNQNLLVAYVHEGLTGVSWVDAKGVVLPALVLGADRYDLVPSPTENEALIVAWRGGIADFYLVSEAGKQFTEVATDVGGVPQWLFAADGRRLAVSGQIRGKEQYVLVDVATGEQATWEKGNTSTDFVFSADNEWFTFSAEVKGQPVLFTVNVNENEPRILVDKARQPVWSP